MRAQIHRFSIRKKILASGILVVLAVSLFTSLYYPHRQRERALASMRERATTLGSTLALAVGIGLELNDYEAVMAALDWVRDDAELRYIAVADTAGEIFASYNPASARIVRSTGVAGTDLDESLDRVTAIVPVKFRGRTHGTLILEMSLEAVRDEIARDRIAAFLVSVVTILVGVGLSEFFARRIAKPIAALRAAADQVAQGNYRIEPLPSRQDEIGSLSDAFNLMIRKISASIAQLEQQAIELESARDQAISSETRYRLLFEANPEPMWVYDSSTLQFLAVNEAAIRHYGYTREEFLGLTIKDIRPADQARRLEEILRSRPSSGFVRNEVIHRKKDGTKIDVEVFADSIEFGGRRARLVLGHDITSRKRLEEQFRQAQKMEAVGRLAGGVAHDFNNILTVLLSTTEFLLERSDTPQDVADDLAEIRRGVQRAAGLTRQLLAFSRKQVLAPQVLDLNDVVQGMEKMLTRLVGEDVQLRTALAKDLGRVRADPGQLEQVIMNLAVNARDAMPAGGALIMTTGNIELDEAHAREYELERSGRYVLIRITDTGSGMSAETRAHIFEPFFTTKQAGHGTGLGLATVYGIVQQSGGGIRVDSELGKGSTFSVFLPRIDEAIVTDKGTCSNGDLHGTETILLAEDEEPVRRVTTKILGRLGYKVIEAASGMEALELARTLQSVELLVTDVIMPLMSGPELAERMRRLIPGVRVLYISGYTDDAIARHGGLEPGVAFLQKPFRPEDLARTVRESLQEKGLG